MMLAIFGAIALFFVAAERRWPARAQPLLRRGFFTDASYVAIHYLMRVVINGTVAVALAEVGRRILPGGSVGLLNGRPLWVQALTLLLVLDLIFYVMHRLKHRWGWWWRLHETHHSSVDLDWLSSARFHPVEKLVDRTVYLLPLLVLGASSGALLVWAAVDALFGMFIHANVRWRIGPLIYLFVGPEMHRWHHSTDRARRECNYGNNFSIFDWLFGTAYLSREEPTRFGVDDPAYPEATLVGQFLYAFRR
ncbi:MAG TPA: sterol desaturase family protein [Methylomirabilota bacterium]|jgi:sterol desaturase/sphingolipid hydroxylase (fatty acid hydroxylase superfamily)|nr:sterol desaturase family protein [Methylomirabilota bacterium]